VTGEAPQSPSGICLYFVAPTESDAAPTTPNLLSINHIAEQPDWNCSCLYPSMGTMFVPALTTAFMSLQEGRNDRRGLIARLRGEVGDEDMFATIIGDRVYLRLWRRNVRQLDAILDHPDVGNRYLARKDKNGVSFVVLVEDDADHYEGRDPRPGLDKVA